MSKCVTDDSYDLRLSLTVIRLTDHKCMRICSQAEIMDTQENCVAEDASEAVERAWRWYYCATSRI